MISKVFILYFSRHCEHSDDWILSNRWSVHDFEPAKVSPAHKILKMSPPPKKNREKIKESNVGTDVFSYQVTWVVTMQTRALSKKFSTGGVGGGGQAGSITDRRFTKSATKWCSEFLKLYSFHAMVLPTICFSPIKLCFSAIFSKRRDGSKRFFTTGGFSIGPFCNILL